MVDYEAGLKRDVAEVKFLIHDLRVEKFVNEVIHFHVTLNTDLEIHDVEQARSMHEDDLRELKRLGGECRNSLRAYSNAVRSFSPDRTILEAGRRHIHDIHEVCELILDPMWGRVDRVLSFLPEDCRSVQSRNHYRNCIHWICGVYYRIGHFLEELEGVGAEEAFQAGADVRDFTRSVIRGYVVEKSKARVELQLGRLDEVVVRGSRHRFRRMYFNLVMNAVDAMAAKKVGVLNVSVTRDGDHAVLRVRDNGKGMSEEKIAQLLSERESLDGELHSLGFVFVRQTIANFGGELLIDSRVGGGTTIEVRLPHRADEVPAPRRRSRCEKYEVHWGEETPAEEEEPVTDEKRPWGRLVFDAYRESGSAHPGSIFAIAVTEADEVDYFTVKPYEKHWGITHEDLAPMFYQATVRGRLEENEDGSPVLILKPPQIVREYFEFKELRESEWSAERFLAMVRDELVRIARKLAETGLPPEVGVEVADLPKYFPEGSGLTDGEPFPLAALAKQRLADEPE